MNNKHKVFIFRFISAILLLILPIAVFADYNIAIIKSSSLTSFNETAEGFSSTILQKPNYKVVEYDLDGKMDKAEEIAAEITKKGMNLIFAVGERAAFAATNYTKDIPIIFATILNYKTPQFKLVDNPLVAGISLEVPPEITFMQMQMVVRQPKRAGIIYSDRSREIVENIKANPALKGMGVEIITEHIKRDRDVTGRRGAMAKLINQKIDIYFMVPDAEVYTTDNTRFLIEECRTNKIPFIAYSDAFVRAGALMSISPSYPTIGSQAASIAESILDYKMSPADLGIVSPIGTLFVISAITVDVIGLNVPEAVYSFADIVYRAED